MNFSIAKHDVRFFIFTNTFHPSACLRIIANFPVRRKCSLAGSVLQAPLAQPTRDSWLCQLPIHKNQVMTHEP